jgi:hypothetical protein
MSQRPRQRFVQFDPDEQRRENDRILGAPGAAQEPAARLLGPAEARASVPVRPPSKYAWNPFSLFSGLAAATLPLLSPPAWKICTVVAVRQLHLGVSGQNAGTPVAISLDDFCVATDLSRMTVIKAIRSSRRIGLPRRSGARRTAARRCRFTRSTGRRRSASNASVESRRRDQ